MRTPILLVLFILLTFPLRSQNYFQQEVNYRIAVTLNDQVHTLSGNAEIQYINNSPDQLGFIYFHLWPNAYKNTGTAFARQLLENGDTDFYFSDSSEKGYIDSLNFTVNSEEVTMVPDSNNIDICRIILNKPLLPGDTILISTPFFVKIPDSFSRMGHVGQSYQITQWYPKPAVYDPRGWHPIPYLDQGEFYSEFGSFDVSITLPAGYIVGATGNLVTPAEIEWLNKKASISSVADDSLKTGDVQKTIRYHEKNIHDFAWFADKNYLVRKGEVTLASGRKVTTWAMYPSSEEDTWKNATEYVGDAVKYYSKWYGEYPYNNCSAVSGAIDAGGAMEYPTITVVGSAGTVSMLEDFIMHEVGHNWFYGVLGFNEREHPMLDEGLNTFSEMRYMRTKYPHLKLHEWITNQSALSSLANIKDVSMTEYYNLSYLFSTRSGTDQPMNLHSELFSALNYGTIAYDKSALVYTYLFEYLGEEHFDKIMQKFFVQWQYKHPYPAELRKAFEEDAQEDLAWLFDDLMTTRKRFDYSVRQVNGDKIVVKNKGQVASPVQISWSDEKGTGSAWYPGFKGRKELSIHSLNPGRIALFDSMYLPEFNRRNNYYHTRGLFKRMEPLSIDMVQVVEKPARTLVGILPVLGWNNYNKTMLGVLLYNPLIPDQTFEYQLMPMIGNFELAGMGKVAFSFHPVKGFLKTVKLSVDGKRFESDFGESYNRAKAELLLELSKKNPRSPYNTSFKLGALTVHEPGVPTMGPGEYYFITLDANIINNNALHPFGINLNFEKADSYLKSSVTLNWSRDFNYASKAVQLRFYAGTVIDKSGISYAPLQLSGASGSDDYRYENLYLGRYEKEGDPNRQKLLSQQFVRNEGGFASYIPFGRSDEWLVTAGLTAKVPKLKMISLFANAGTYSNAGVDKLLEDGVTTIQTQSLVWEAGAMVKLGILSVYFPVMVSEDIADANKVFTSKYIQTVRFVIDFNAVNPFRLKSTMFQ